MVDNVRGWMEKIPENAVDDSRLIEAMKHLERSFEKIKEVVASQNPELIPSAAVPSHSNIIPQRYPLKKKETGKPWNEKTIEL